MGTEGFFQFEIIINGLVNVSHVVLSEAVDWCICFTPKIQHGGDLERSRPQDPKNVHINDCATSELSMRTCNLNATDSKKPIVHLIFQRYIQIWQSNQTSMDVRFWRLKSVHPTESVYCDSGSKLGSHIIIKNLHQIFTYVWYQIEINVSGVKLHQCLKVGVESEAVF